MKSLLRSLILLAGLHFTNLSYSQNATPPVNYLNTPSQLSFNNTAFNLVWSSHPTATYYKQEYLPKGENVNRFSNMLLLEVVSSGVSHKDAVAAKTAELKTMKQANPAISYESYYHKENDEYVLDFVLTASSADGKRLEIAEHNVYRYKKYTGANGESGVILFGVSKRSYGSEAAKFIGALTPASRQELVNKVKLFAIPAIKLK